MNKVSKDNETTARITISQSQTLKWSERAGDASSLQQRSQQEQHSILQNLWQLKKKKNRTMLYVYNQRDKALQQIDRLKQMLRQFQARENLRINRAIDSYNKPFQQIEARLRDQWRARQLFKAGLAHKQSSNNDLDQLNKFIRDFESRPALKSVEMEIDLDEKKLVREDKPSQTQTSLRQMRIKGNLAMIQSRLSQAFQRIKF